MAVFQSSHPQSKREWNEALRQHVVYVAAALHRPVGELRVALLDAPVMGPEGRLGFPQTAWALACAGVQPAHMYILERSDAGMAALRHSIAGSKLSAVHLVHATVGAEKMLPQPLPLPRDVLDLVVLDSCSNRCKVTQHMVPHLMPHLRPTAIMVLGICRNRNRDALPGADRSSSIAYIQQQATRDLAALGGQPFQPLCPILHELSHAPHTLMVYLAVAFGDLPTEPCPIRHAAGDWLTGIRLLEGEKKTVATRALGMTAPPRHKRVVVPRRPHVTKRRLLVSERWSFADKRQPRKRKFLADEQAQQHAL